MKSATGSRGVHFLTSVVLGWGGVFALATSFLWDTAAAWGQGVESTAMPEPAPRNAPYGPEDEGTPDNPNPEGARTRQGPGNDPAPPPEEDPRLPAAERAEIAWNNLFIYYLNGINLERGKHRYGALDETRELARQTWAVTANPERFDGLRPAGAEPTLWHRVFTAEEAKALREPGSSLVYHRVFITCFPWRDEMSKVDQRVGLQRLARLHATHPEIGPLVTAAGYNVWSARARRGKVRVGTQEVDVVRMAVAVGRKDLTLLGFAIAGGAGAKVHVSGEAEIGPVFSTTYNPSREPPFLFRLVKIGEGKGPAQFIGALAPPIMPGNRDQGFFMRVSFAFVIPAEAGPGRYRIEVRRREVDEQFPAQVYDFDVGPQGRVAGGAFPLIEISHGAGGPPDQANPLNAPPDPAP